MNEKKGEIKSRKIIKGTFEATLSSQERLREKLDALIEENRPIKDSVERSEFMRLLAHATLGLGTNQEIRYHIPNGYEPSFCSIRRDFETTARWLAYQKTNVVHVPMELYSGKRETDEKIVDLPIKFLWQVLLENLFSIFPLALDRSMSMSKEKDENIKSSGYTIGSYDTD